MQLTVVVVRQVAIALQKSLSFRALKNRTKALWFNLIYFLKDIKMLEVNLPEIRIKKENQPELRAFPLCSFNDLAQFILVSKKNCSQANPFYLQFCSAAVIGAWGEQSNLFLLEMWLGSL